MRRLLLLFLFGCAAGKATVPVLRPAEINLVAYQTLGISSFTGGPMAPVVSAALEEKLLASQRFNVVDRSRVDAVMNELQLASTDLAADTKGAVKLGNLMTAGALISGDVRSDYRETPHEERLKSKSGETHTHRWTEATFRLDASFRLTDVSTGGVLISRTISVEKTSNPGGALASIATSILGAIISQTLEKDVTDAPPDRSELEREAVAEVVGKFAAAIQPTTEMREVRFELDDALPQLQGGFGWAQRGDWLKARATFNTAIQDAERDTKIGAQTLWKAYYDAALTYEYGGEPEKATPLLEKAYSLSPGNSRILDEMESVKRMQAEQRKLAEQTAPK